MRTVVCDVCGKTLSAGDNTNSDRVILFEQVSDDSDNGFYKILETFDMCESCFNAKLDYLKGNRDFVTSKTVKSL